jgi:hypothetical protein
LLGPFALAFPKRTKVKEFAVGVHWENDGGLTQHAVIGFSGNMGAGAANEVANTLRITVLPRLQQTQAGGAADTSVPPDPYEQIRELADLRASGAITDQEYEMKKVELLRRI